MQVFKNSRTALATAMTSAALLGAATVAGLTLVFDDGAPAAAPQQVTVTNSAPAASSSTSTVGQIYKRSADAVVKITVTSAGQAPARSAAAAAPSRRRAPASSTTPRAT